MKKLPIFLLLAFCCGFFSLQSCGDDDSTSVWDTYSDWREQNDDWIKEQQMRTNADGTPYFKTLVPSWNPNLYVLIHYFNDRNLTEGNLSPMITSTIDARYIGRYCTDVAFDSSYTQTTYGPGIYRTQLTAVITGWAIAFQDMRVGDTAEIVIPYEAAYGATTTSGIAPYSNLKFNVSLVDIPYYEVNPK